MDLSAHPLTHFLRRRLQRGAPYGLGFTVAFAAVALTIWGFVEVLDAVVDAEGLARLDALAHTVLYDAFGQSTRLGLTVTWFGNNATIIGLVVLVSAGLVLAKRYWAAFRVVFASGVGGLVLTGLKLLFARERPLDKVIPADGYSFPSGHAFASTVFYGMMVYIVWRLTENRAARAVAVVLGPLMFIAVGLSRVYLNVHYLTDVVAGWLAGTAWLVASLMLVYVVESRTRSRHEQEEEQERPPDAEP